MSRYKWVLLGLLVGFWGLVGINRLGITYLFPVIRPEFHMSLTQLSFLIGGTSVTWAFSSWISGWLSDRYGRRRVLLPGAVFACLSTMAMGATWNFLSLFVVRDLIGVGDGVGWPNGQSTLAEEVPPERRAVVAGVFTAGYPFFGVVLGAPVITFMAANLGWRWVFPILGAIFLLVVFGLYRVMREPQHSAQAERLDWRNLFTIARDRRVILLMLVQSGALGWLQVSALYNTLFLTAKDGPFHVGLVQAGAILSIVGVGGIVGTLLLPFLSDYVGRKPALLAGGVLSSLMLGLYIFGHFPLSVAVPLLVANAFFQGVLVPLGSATYVVELVGEEVRATTMGGVNFVGVMLGTLLLPVLAGVLGDRFGMSTGFLVAVISVGVAGLLALALPETAPRVLSRRTEAVAPA